MQWIHKNYRFKNQTSGALNPLVLLFGHLVVHSARISANRHNSYSFAPWLLEIFNPAYGFKLVLYSIKNSAALTIAGSKNRPDIVNKTFFKLSNNMRFLEKPQGRSSGGGCGRCSYAIIGEQVLECRIVYTHITMHNK